MAVRNTGWTATSDRLTDELTAPFEAGLPSGAILRGTVYFPPCAVKFVRPGVWSVAAFRAWIFGEDGVQIGFIDYPREPIHRQGRLMIAEEVTSVYGAITLASDLGGIVTSTLAEIPADPFPLWRGGALAGYVVRPVVCPGSVEWHQ